MSAPPGQPVSLPDAEQSDRPRAYVERTPLPTPDAALIFDHDRGRVTVLADPRVSDARVEQLRQAAEILMDVLPRPRRPFPNEAGI